MKSAKDGIIAAAVAGAVLVSSASAQEQSFAPKGRFTIECREAIPHHRDKYTALLNQSNRLKEKAQCSHIGKMPIVGNVFTQHILAKADVYFQEAMKYSRVKWTVIEDNTVTTPGKNDLLDKYFAGSSYTATWFCGLISLTSFSAINAADTMASHAGWLEAGGSNAPTYSGARPALAFSAASGASKATSSASSFTFTGSGTIKGMFACSITTKDGTTGILYNAVLFTGGDQPVVNTNVVNVSVTYSA